MSFFMKLVGGAILVLCIVGLLAAGIGLAIGSAKTAEEHGAEAAGVLATVGTIQFLFFFGGGMALGTILYVGGKSLDYMGQRTRNDRRARRYTEGPRRPRRRTPGSRRAKR